MPQEHHVVKCFSCETFQVHIVKKVRKWECKVCGAKQSLKRNYGKGSAKDCRIHVMKLNEMRLTKTTNLEEIENEVFEDSENYLEKQDLKKMMETKVPSSKWDEYLEDNTSIIKSDTDDDDDDEPNFFLETKKMKKRVKKLTKEFHPKPKKVCLGASTNEELSEPCEVTIPLVASPEKKFYNKNSPVQMKNKLQRSKYAKYVDEEEEKNEFITLQEVKHLNIFDSEPTDLDTVLNFE